MNNDQPLIWLLKEALKPNEAGWQFVRIGFVDGPSNVAFYDAAFIHRAIDEMAVRLVTHSIDPITPLERLAIELLLSSACLQKAEDRAAALAAMEAHKYPQSPTGEKS